MGWDAMRNEDSKECEILGTGISKEIGSEQEKPKVKTKNGIWIWK
jgi:hypothetical protein